MASFEGRLQGLSLEPSYVTIEVSDERIRIVAGRRHMGSWPLNKVSVQRTSVYRFSFEIDSDHLEFFPEDPAEFSDAVGAVVDLTETKGRYGLKARIQDAAGS